MLCTASAPKDEKESATHEKEGASSPDKHLVELSDTYGLSDREREVFQRLLKGYSLPHVAEDMSLSKNTVATHAQHVYKKFNVHSKQELIDFVEKNLGKKVAGKMFDSKESDVRQL